MDQKLRSLRQTTDEMMHQLQASSSDGYRIWSRSRKKQSGRFHIRMEILMPAAACLLLAVGIAMYRVPGTGIVPVATPMVASIAAGDSPQPTGLPVRADVPQGSVQLSGSGSAAFRNLFAGSSADSFPMLHLNGQYYRLLSSPSDLSRQHIGAALGTVSVYSSSSEQIEGCIASNTVLEGETVYAIQQMDGTAVAARINGEMRVFQRVSLNGQGTESYLPFALNGPQVTQISVSGIGSVSGSAAADLFQTLLAGAAYQSGGCTATSQGLYITFSNGITLQYYVSGSTIMGCGSWSCPTFFDALRNAVV